MADTTLPTKQKTYTVKGTFEPSRKPDLPVKGLKPGSIISKSSFPDDPVCPFCDTAFVNANGLRAHAAVKHGIKWEKTGTGLPVWMYRLSPHHYIALQLREVYGLSWKEIGKRLGKEPRNLKRMHRESPLAQEYCAKVREMVANPEFLARILMESHTVNIAADHLMALEWAKEAKDYKAVHKFTETLLSSQGVIEDKVTAPAQEVHIHLDAGSLETPHVRTSYSEATVDGDWEEDDDGSDA